MKKKSLLLLGLLGLVVALTPVTAFAGTSSATQSKTHSPHILFQKGHNHNHNQPESTPPSASAASTTVSTNNLVYNGGPVMGGTMNVYLIFWQPSGTLSINQGLIENYFTDVGSSALYQIAKQYTDSLGHFPSGSQLAGTWMDMQAYPNAGTSTLYDTDIQAEVTRAQQAKGWTPGLNNMFFVFTEKDENICYKDSLGNLTGCTPSPTYLQLNLRSYFCAYHSYIGTDPTGANDSIYAAMPYAASPSFNNNCNPEAPGGFTPNGDDADMTINVTSHEQMEAATDPLLNAWYDASQNEIGDKCAWTFGPVNGESGDVIWYNSSGNGDNYLVQQEWSNKVSGCVLSTSTTRQYYQIVNRKSGLVMDVTGGGTTNGAQVIQWTNHHGHNQEWYLVPDGDTYQIVNRNSGLVLDVYGGGKTQGANVIQWTNHNGLNQQWWLDPDGQYNLIQNVNSLLVADVSGGSTSAGAHVIQWGFNGGANQQWSLVPVPPQTYYVIKNVNSGLVMDVSGGSTSAGAHVIQWPANGGTNQEWSPRLSQSVYQFVNVKSGLVLDVYGGGTNAGAQVIQWTNHNSKNQQWQLLPGPDLGPCLTSSGCQIQNVNSHLVLDVSGGSKTAGANVIQYTNHNSTNQQWIFIPVVVVP